MITRAFTSAFLVDENESRAVYELESKYDPHKSRLRHFFNHKRVVVAIAQIFTLNYRRRKCRNHSAYYADETLEGCMMQIALYCEVSCVHDIICASRKPKPTREPREMSKLAPAGTEVRVPRLD